MCPVSPASLCVVARVPGIRDATRYVRVCDWRGRPSGPPGPADGRRRGLRLTGPRNPATPEPASWTRRRVPASQCSRAGPRPPTVPQDAAWSPVGPRLRSPPPAGVGRKDQRQGQEPRARGRTELASGQEGTHLAWMRAQGLGTLKGHRRGTPGGPFEGRAERHATPPGHGTGAWSPPITDTPSLSTWALSGGVTPPPQTPLPQHLGSVRSEAQFEGS